jgi:hypothetical protein
VKTNLKPVGPSILAPLLTVFFCLGGITSSVGQSDQAKGQSDGPSKDLPIRGEVFRVEGHTAFLMLPEGGNATKAMPWVWYAPTLPGLLGPEEARMFRKFLDAGIAVAGIDAGESYGSPTCRALYSALYRELVGKRGLSGRPCLLARSRGGLMLYNWAVENADRRCCTESVAPA